MKPPKDRQQFSLESWGRHPRQTAEIRPWNWAPEPPPWQSGTVLAYGLGRSYGDSCLNEGGTLVPIRNLNHFLSFDETTGELVCEAGVSLKEIIRFAVPRGWYLPTNPGTKFVTVGGAIANDIHGKNHHRAGTFGCHVNWLELVQSDGTRRRCSPTMEAELFNATIGGLGLTGFIASASIRLRRITSAFLDVFSQRFDNLDGFFELSAAADKDYEFTVSWVDCVSSGAKLGRGIFMAGNHAQGSGGADLKLHGTPRARLPFDFPGWALNRASVAAFNTLYYWKHFQRTRRGLMHYEPFFYPLDSVHDWNRLYGRRGFFQYQSVVPWKDGRAATRAMFERISRSGQASFLAVLKVFGSLSSPGLMSFPQPGITLALDFPNKGEVTERLFVDLDAIVREAGGRLYPAKDARMPAADFRRAYPQWEKFAKLVDPRCSSSFWRRVTA